MKIKLAKNLGFCFGVKRAISLILKALKDNPGRPVYTLGPLIHNPIVVRGLEKKGLKVIHSCRDIKDGMLVIPSHGLAYKVQEKARSKGIKLLDATCPYVLRSQRLACMLAEEGYEVIVIGERFHPEIKGILGTIHGTCRVVNEIGDLLTLPKFKRAGVIVQTTESLYKLKEIVSALLEKADELKVYNTLCIHTMRRQEEAVKLARDVDVMLVVGGHNSANTRRLYELCKKIVPAYQVESAAELELKLKRNKRLREILKSKKKAGIVSGTSTPYTSIKELMKKLKKI